MALMASATLSLMKWHEMIAQRDLSDLEQVIAKDALFRSPGASKPYPGQAVVCVVLRGAMNLFEDFAYHRTFISGDRDICLEFSARFDDKEVKGVDLIKFDANGKIAEFEVMVRPAIGLQALSEKMQSTVGPRIKELLEGA